MKYIKEYETLNKKLNELENNLLKEIKDIITKKGFTHRGLSNFLNISIRSATYLFNYETQEQKLLNLDNIIECYKTLKNTFK